MPNSHTISGHLAFFGQEEYILKKKKTKYLKSIYSNIVLYKLLFITLSVGKITILWSSKNHQVNVPWSLQNSLEFLTNGKVSEQRNICASSQSNCWLVFVFQNKKPDTFYKINWNEMNCKAMAGLTFLCTIGQHFYRGPGMIQIKLSSPELDISSPVQAA